MRSFWKNVGELIQVLIANELIPIGFIHNNAINPGSLQDFLVVNLVTTIFSHNDELFDRESALFVGPRDVTALTKALTSILEDAELRKRLANNGKLRVRSKFTLDSMLRNHFHLYFQQWEKMRAKEN